MEFWLACGWPHFFLCVNRISGPEVISDAPVQALNCMVCIYEFHPKITDVRSNAGADE
jgi:hypothetical protein